MRPTATGFSRLTFYLEKTMSLELFEFTLENNVEISLAVDRDWKNDDFTSLEHFLDDLNSYFIYSDYYLRKANGDKLLAGLMRIAEHLPVEMASKGWNLYGAATSFHEDMGSEAYPNLDGSNGIYLVSCSVSRDDFDVEFHASKEITHDELKEFVHNLNCSSNH